MRADRLERMNTWFRPHSLHWTTTRQCNYNHLSRSFPRLFRNIRSSILCTTGVKTTGRVHEYCVEEEPSNTHQGIIVAPLSITNDKFPYHWGIDLSCSRTQCLWCRMCIIPARLLWKSERSATRIHHVHSEETFSIFATLILDSKGSRQVIVQEPQTEWKRAEICWAKTQTR